MGKIRQAGWEYDKIVNGSDSNAPVCRYNHYLITLSLLLSVGP